MMAVASPMRAAASAGSASCWTARRNSAPRPLVSSPWPPLPSLASAASLGLEAASSTTATPGATPSSARRAVSDSLATQRSHSLTAASAFMPRPSTSFVTPTSRCADLSSSKEKGIGKYSKSSTEIILAASWKEASGPAFAKSMSHRPFCTSTRMLAALRSPCCSVCIGRQPCSHVHAAPGSQSSRRRLSTATSGAHAASSHTSLGVSSTKLCWNLERLRKVMPTVSSSAALSAGGIV